MERKSREYSFSLGPFLKGDMPRALSAHNRGTIPLAAEFASFGVSTRWSHQCFGLEALPKSLSRLSKSCVSLVALSFQPRVPHDGICHLVHETSTKDEVLASGSIVCHKCAEIFKFPICSLLISVPETPAPS